jgi:hypothetical protein
MKESATRTAHEGGEGAVLTIDALKKLSLEQLKALSPEQIQEMMKSYATGISELEEQRGILTEQLNNSETGRDWQHNEQRVLSVDNQVRELEKAVGALDNLSGQLERLAELEEKKREMTEELNNSDTGRDWQHGEQKVIDMNSQIAALEAEIATEISLLGEFREESRETLSGLIKRLQEESNNDKDAPADAEEVDPTVLPDAEIVPIEPELAIETPIVPEVHLPVYPTNEAPPAPIEPEKPQGKRKLGIIETDLVEKRAREEAAERMNRNKDELKGVSGFFKKIWTHNWMAEYYRAREVEKVRKELNDAGSTFGEADEEGVLDTKAKEAILERFLHESPGLVHEVAGEWKEKVDAESEGKRAAAHEEIRLAILDYVGSADIDLAEGNLTEAVNRVYQGMFEDSADGFEPLNIADNIQEYAREIRAQVEHGTALADLDLDFELTFGKAVTGARTEADYTWRDKVIEKMSKSPVGRFVNETTIAAAVCASAGIAQSLTRWSLRATVGAVGGGILAGGGLAALRESQATERDRADHARSMATGRTFDIEKSARRKEMQEAVYSMMPVQQAVRSLEEHRTILETKGAALDEADIMSTLDLVANVDAHIYLSDRRKIDILSYSSPEDIESERTDLDIEKAAAMAAAREAYNLLDLGRKFGDFDRMVECQRYGAMQVLEHGNPTAGTEDTESIAAKDKIFKSLKRRRMSSAFKKGAVTAGVAGLVFHGAVEGYNALTDDSSAHAAELASANPETLKLGSFMEGGTEAPGEEISMIGTETVREDVINGTTHHMTKVVEGALRLPSGFHALPVNGGSEYEIVAGGNYDADGHLVDYKTVAEHIKFNTAVDPILHPDYMKLTPESIQALKKTGFAVSSPSQPEISFYSSHPMTIEQPHTFKSAAAYTSEHSDEFNRTHRLGWGDNGTAKPDLNELKLRDPELGSDGKIHVSIANMTRGGSVMNGRSINPVELAKEGKMELWVSASKGTQFTPAQITFDSKGIATIDPDSAAGKLFSFDEKGALLSRPRFTEAVAIVGNAKDGLKNGIVCGTDEGVDMQEINSTVSVVGVQEDANIKVVTELIYRDPEPILIPGADGYQIPVPIPFFVPRTPLERLNRKNGIKSPYYGSNSLSQLEREMTKPKKAFSPDSYFERNVDDKNIWVDKDGNPVKRDVEREKTRLKEYLDQQEEPFLAELKGYEKSIDPMHEKCRVSINIPARFEEVNLPNLLDQYVKQVEIDGSGAEVDKDTFEINIIVNRKEGEAPDRSLEVIDEWKAENPGYHVNVIDAVFPKEKANVGTARKYITDLTLMRSVNRPASDGPLYIESEDADLFSVDKRTVSRLIKGFDESPHLDVLRGVQDRQPEILQQNDLLFFDRRVWDIWEMALRKVAYRPENTKGNSFVWNRVISGGWNTAYTAEAYVQIGGYVPDLIGEDMKIGQKISILRGVKDAATNEFIINTQTSETSGLRASSSPRRFIDTMSRNIDPYGDFEDQSLKEKTLPELLEGIKEFAKIAPEQKGRYENILRVMIDTSRAQAIPSQASAISRRVLWAMGLKEKQGDYLLDAAGNFSLTDKGMMHIGTLLEDYKSKEKYKLGYRRQNSPLAV